MDALNALDGLNGKVRHGATYEIIFSAESFTGWDVEQILRRYGVRIWGRRLTPDRALAIQVKPKQAAWAEYVLARAGVPMLQPHAATRDDGTMPVPWGKGTKKRSITDRVTTGLAPLLGMRSSFIDSAKFSKRKRRGKK